MHLPLKGTRILDLTRVLAGPLCTMTLGDLGADVIKVERLGVGDESRCWGPPFDERGESAYYLSINRNKLGIALNLDREEDRHLLLSLVRDAHVIVDNYRRGTLERRGIDPAAILNSQPNLIWCTLTGFGAESGRPGYDFVVQAECGWMSVTGPAEGEPTKVGIALADVVAGKDAAIAILGALSSRTPRPAEDRRLFISLAHSATSALVNVAQNALVSGRDAARWGNGHANLVPYQLFHARDRRVVIAVGNDQQWQSLCTALGLDALSAAAHLASNKGRLAHRAEVVDAIQARVQTMVASEVLVALAHAGVPAGVVRTVNEALADVSASPLTGVAPPFAGSVRLPPPKLDEHGERIRTLGWDVFASFV